MINHLLAKLWPKFWVPTEERSSSFPFKFRSGFMLLCSHIVAAWKDNVCVKCSYVHVRKNWLFFLKGVKRNQLVSSSWLKLGLVKWFKGKLTVARAQDVVEKVDGRWCIGGALCGWRSGGEILWHTLVTQNKEASLKFGSIPTSFPSKSVGRKLSRNIALLEDFL